MTRSARFRKAMIRLAVSSLAAMAAVTALASTANAAGITARPGSVIYVDNSVCTLGPLMSWKDASNTITYGALTAGHCGEFGDTVYLARTEERIGSIAVSEYNSFGSDDYALVAFDHVNYAAPAISNKGVGAPSEGMRVRTFGGISGDRVGTVTATQSTSFDVSFPAVKGDSGGAVYGVDSEGIHLLGIIQGYNADTGKAHVVTAEYALRDMPSVAPLGAR